MTSTLWFLFGALSALCGMGIGRVILHFLDRHKRTLPVGVTEKGLPSERFDAFTFRYVLCYCCHKHITEGEIVVADSDGQRMMHRTCFEHLLADKWDLANVWRDAQKGQEEEP